MLNFGLNGRVVVVTGAASGIGLAAAKRLAQDGAHVAIIDMNADTVDAAVKQVSACTQDGSRVMGAVADVRHPHALQAAADCIGNELGTVWGLVASAGISGANKAEDLTLEEWNRIFSVNVTGAFSTCQVFGQSMRERGCGSIVLIGSIDGLYGQPGRTHYVASKHAVAGMIKNLAIEWGRHGIRVNGVAPGPVDTPMVHQALPPSFVANVVKDRTPLGRMAEPAEVANACLMLLSDAASFVHGTMLPVDGGMTTGPFLRHQGMDLGSRRLLEAGLYREDELKSID